MRRLVRHGFVGVGLGAVAAVTAVVTLTGPSDQLQAVPAPAAVSAAAPAPAVRNAAATRPVVPAADRADRVADQRSRTLVGERRSITSTNDGLAGADTAAQQKAERTAKAKAVQKAKAVKKAKATAAAKREAAALEKASDEAARRLQARDTRKSSTPTGSPREIAKQLLADAYDDAGDRQYSCFNNIIIRESNWDIDATNRSSGAYGIPQALPGSKMAKYGSDWRTNPATQIKWAIGYMKDRYGSPCEAWSFKSARGWY